MTRESGSQPSTLNPQPSTLNPEAGHSSWEPPCCSPSSTSMARSEGRAVLPLVLAGVLLLFAPALVSGVKPKKVCNTCTCNSPDLSKYGAPPSLPCIPSCANMALPVQPAMSRVLSTKRIGRSPFVVGRRSFERCECVIGRLPHCDPSDWSATPAGATVSLPISLRRTSATPSARSTRGAGHRGTMSSIPKRRGRTDIGGQSGLSTTARKGRFRHWEARIFPTANAL